MRQLKFYCTISLLLFSIIVCAQQGFLIENSNNSFMEQQSSLSFFNNIDNEDYQFSIMSNYVNRICLDVNFRMEDELSSEESYKLLNSVAFFDVVLNYNLGDFDFNLLVENLLNWNDSVFAIEPEIDENKGIINSVYFTHESDFLMSASITYRF